MCLDENENEKGQKKEMMATEQATNYLDIEPASANPKAK